MLLQQFLQHPCVLGRSGFLHVNELLAKKLKTSVHQTTKQDPISSAIQEARGSQK